MTEAVYGLYIAVVSALPLITSAVPFFKDKEAPPTVLFIGFFFFNCDRNVIYLNDWLIDSIALGSYRSTTFK